MWRSVWNVEHRARKEIVALIVENHEAFAALHVNRFFAVQMFSGMPTDRNFRAHQAAASRRKSGFRRDHQSGFVILRRTHPLEILAMRDAWRLINYFLVLFRPFQPGRIKIAHCSSSITPFNIAKKLSDPPTLVKLSSV